MEETKEDIMDDMETGEKEETVYDEEGREKLVEDGELESWEDGFMEGAEDDGEQGKCANCGGPLMDPEHTFETEIDDKVYWFCSEHCLQAYKEKKEQE